MENYRLGLYDCRLSVFLIDFADVVKNNKVAKYYQYILFSYPAFCLESI